MRSPTLLVVPNVSEGRDQRLIEQIARAFTSALAPPPAPAPPPRTPSAPEPPKAPDSPGAVRLLNTHSDSDHHRSVYTLAGPPGALATALLQGARATVDHVDLAKRDETDPASAGRHPHVGALDVVPLVYLSDQDRGPACAEALVTAELIAHELAVPVFLYGELTQSADTPPRTRAQLRRGGLQGLTARILSDGHDRLVPDFGPRVPHPSAGATLVSARPPLVAFNLILAPPATPQDARRIAAELRESASTPRGPQGTRGTQGIRGTRGPQRTQGTQRTQGIPGLRAIGIELAGGVPQLSMNVEQPHRIPLAEIIAAVQTRATVASAELVGLAPKAAFADFPPDIPIPGFDPARHLIENAIGCS